MLIILQCLQIYDNRKDTVLVKLGLNINLEVGLI